MSKMAMEAIVQDVEMRKVEKRDGSGTMTLYDVVIGDGTKWTAFDRDLAERAYNLKGTTALLEVTVEQKGSYTNKNLRAIQAKPTSGFTPALSAMEAQIGNGGGSTGGFPEESNSHFTQKALVEEPTYKERTIWRQTASKVAAVISKTEGEFWANLDQLVKYYETGEKPNQDPFADMQQQVADDTSDIPF